jgi:hypothetical protein
MTQRIIYSNPDGTMSVVIPTGETDIIHVLVNDVPPEATDAEIVDIGVIPADRVFRNAWEKSGSGIVTHLEKARAITENLRRSKRAEFVASMLDNQTDRARLARIDARQNDVAQAPDVATLRALVDQLQL